MTELYHAIQLTLFNPSIEHVTPDCVCVGKYCKPCSTVKCHQAFHRDKKGAYELTWRCKSCVKAYRTKNAEYFREKRKAYHQATSQYRRDYMRSYWLSHTEKKKTYDKTYRQKHAEQIHSYHRAWRQDHYEQLKVRRKTYRSQNIERLKAHHKEYARRNIDRKRQYDKVRRENHREYLLAYDRYRYQTVHRKEWTKFHQLCHPDLYMSYRKTGDQRRRARERGATGTFTTAEWWLLKQQYDNTCLCCGCTDVKLTADHVIPLCKGGTNDISNIQPLCRSCNCKKGRKTIDYR